MSGKILLVEDEHSIAEPVIYNLKQEGFSDKQIADQFNTSNLEIRELRQKYNIKPIK